MRKWIFITLILVALLASPVWASSSLTGDINGDRRVDQRDIALLQTVLSQGDLTGDGLIDQRDIEQLQEIIKEQAEQDAQDRVKARTINQILQSQRNKGRLYRYLSDGSVASVWWDLSDRQRATLGQAIIKWWGLPKVNKYKWYCADVNGVSEWRERTAYCGVNAVVRVSIIGAPEGVSTCGEYYQVMGKTWYDFCESPAFGLPCYLAGIRYEGHTGFSHCIAALQVGEDMSDFNSWIFFQYSDRNIGPGNSQMPKGSTVAILNVQAPLHCGGYMSYASIEEWKV